MKFFSNFKNLIKTVGPRNEVDDTMSLTILIQRIMGQHILNLNWTWKRFILYQIVGAALILYTFLGTKEMLMKTTDIKDIAEACFTYAAISILLIKYLLFVNERFLFRKLYIIAKTSLLDIITEDSYDEKIKVLNEIKRIFKIMLSSSAMTVLSYLLRVLWFYAKGERVYFLKMTATFLPITSPYYEIATIIQMIVLLGVSSTYFCIDIWFMFSVKLYCAASTSLEKVLNVKRWDDEDEESYALRLKDHLRKFYLGHVELVEYLRILNNIYKWQALVPLITVIMLFCVTMLSMTKEFDFSVASNLMPTITEVFVYNWFGEQAKTKANDLRDAFIRFDWVNLQLKDKKSYYIMMTLMNKDFGIVTAVGTELSLITLTTVLKSSYQIFTMLQTFDN